jgi:hypothetical protein
MQISANHSKHIRSINIDEHRTVCHYLYWDDWFPAGTYVSQHLKVIKNALGDSFSRSELIDFYRKKSVNPETKFIAAMIWGHEAAAGGRRDGRGPWKLEQMFEQPTVSEAAIRAVSLNTYDEIIASYQMLNQTLNRCGPNFFTKHFYFLGKAQGLTTYPLIFDNRVANGLVKVASEDQENLNMVQISAVTKPNIYIAYLQFALSEANRIGCKPDQIEYYLFSL